MLESSTVVGHLGPSGQANREANLLYSVAGIKLLPGQKMIGLGCAEEVVSFIRRLVGRLAAVSEVMPRT